MNSVQVNMCLSAVDTNRAGLCSYGPPSMRVRSSYTSHIAAFQRLNALPRSACGLRQRYLPPMCLFGGKGGQGKKDDDVSPWKSLEKAMGGINKERSIQDILREQMQEQEFSGDGGSGKPPTGDGGDGSGNSGDEGFKGMIDEFIQVILATIGFIFLYFYMISGEEWTRLAKDYIKYLFGSRASVRLRRALYVWGRFWRRITAKKQPVPENWLEQAIIATPTTWHDPRELAQVLSRDEDY